METARTMSAKLMERITDGRASQPKYAHIDLFMGPFIGRESSIENLERVCQDIGEPHRFRQDQPLLVVDSDPRLPDGRLYVVGGSHRLLVAAHLLHIHILPYQTLSLNNLTEFGEPVSILTHHAIICHHLEASEPRPRGFSMMQQVKEFGRLRDYWYWRQTQQVREAGKQLRRPPALTLPKLLAAYQELRNDAHASSRYAIEFMSSKTHRAGVPPNNPTIHGYMTGAQRLLDAGVVPYLCELECNDKATFNRRTLNMVKGWKPEKIKDTVDLWKAREQEGLPCDFRFSDKNGSEIDGRRRGRKSSAKKNVAQDSTAKPEAPRKPAPFGWESLLEDWNNPGTLEVLSRLEFEVSKAEQKAKKRIPTDIDELLDIAHKVDVLKQVRISTSAMLSNSNGQTTFDLVDVVRSATATCVKKSASHIAIMVNGGITDESFILYKPDFDPIRKWSMASDNSVLFVMRYLSNWSTHSIGTFYLMDPLLLKLWFQERIRDCKERFISLQKSTRTPQGRQYLFHYRTWHADMTLIPVVGANHWSLVVLVHLPRVLSALEAAERKVNDVISASYWLDSMDDNSLHNGFDDNVYQYLLAIYPGKQNVSLAQLRAALPLHRLSCEVQSSNECGFYVTYHISLVSKKISLFKKGQPEAVQRYINDMYRSYSFGAYRKDVLERLEFLVSEYSKNPNRYTESPPYTWETLTLPTLSKVPVTVSPVATSNIKNETPASVSPSHTEIITATSQENENGTRKRSARERAGTHSENGDDDFMDKLPKRPKQISVSDALIGLHHTHMALRTSLRSTLPLPTSSQRSPGSQIEPQSFNGAQGFGPSSLLRQISPSSPCNNPHKYKQDSADQHPTTSASTIAHPRPELLSAAPPSTPSQAPKAPLLNPPLRSALPPAAHSPSRGTRFPDSDPIPTTVISPAARSSSKPHNAAPVPNLLHRSVPLSHAAKQSPIAPMPSSASAVSTAHGFQQQPKQKASQPQAVTVISHPPVVPKPATQFSSMRHALVGVINGLVAMNCAQSGSQLKCKREVIVSKILEDAVIKMHMVAMGSNESMENAMQKMTPLIISKFQSICSRSSPCPIPNVSHQSFRSPQTSAVPTTSLSSSPQDVTKELKVTSGPTDHHQQRERNMEYTTIVEEGHSLVQRESDLDLKKEWMSCMLKMRELVGKMKERKSA